MTPMPYTADFRPYYTIHDRTFSQLAAQQLPSNSNALPRLLGVTNLYFLKVCFNGQHPVSVLVRPRNESQSGTKQMDIAPS